MTEFPNRPDTPDFWRLSAVLIDQDAYADDPQPGVRVDERITQVIDPASLLYAANQRALRAIALLDMSAPVSALGAIWVDAFLAGTEYQARKSAELKDGEDEGPHADDPDDGWRDKYTAGWPCSRGPHCETHGLDADHD